MNPNVKVLGRRRRSRGAAMVEAAIVLPVLITFFPVVGYLHATLKTSVEVQATARRMAWEHAVNHCDSDPSPELNAVSADEMGKSVTGAASLAEQQGGGALGGGGTGPTDQGAHAADNFLGPSSGVHVANGGFKLVGQEVVSAQSVSYNQWGKPPAAIRGTARHPKGVSYASCNEKVIDGIGPAQVVGYLKDELLGIISGNF